MQFVFVLTNFCSQFWYRSTILARCRVHLKIFWDSWFEGKICIWEYFFTWLFICVEIDSPGASGQFQTIPQHENSSRNSILKTRSFRNLSKFRKYEKHYFSDKTASPASWDTLKLKISLLTQQILWIATAFQAPYALCDLLRQQKKDFVFRLRFSKPTLMMFGKV